MFGKKIDKWTNYKYNLCRLYTDLVAIYTKGECITSRNAQIVVRKLFEYKHHDRSMICKITQLFFDHNLISSEFITEIINNYQHNEWIDINSEYNIPPPHIMLDQKTYLRLFQLGKLEAWNYIDNNCPITQDDFDKIFTNYPNRMDELIPAINHTYPKLLDLMKQYNLTFTLNIVWLIIHEFNSNVSYDELDGVFLFLKKHGYEIPIELVVLIINSIRWTVQHTDNASGVSALIKYTIDIMMPK